LLLSQLFFSPMGQAQGSPAAAKLDAQPAPQAAAAVPSLYATVNGKPVTQAEFHAAYGNFLRQKFYHGQVPQEQLVQARKDVGDQIINRILFMEEIERRGIKPESEDVEKRIQGYDRRYAQSQSWQKNREAMLPGLREQLNLQSQINRLEQAVRDVPLPAAEEVKAFYAAKPELFTEPEKLRLYSILLAVDPSSSRAVWDAALREGEAIVRRIRGGADFGELARLSSNDASAERGGDMGYLHVGMLPEKLQGKIDQFKFGEVADPIEMLQGIGIFRLDERVPAKLQPFEVVSTRARDLLHRERQEKAWKDFVAQLRTAAKIAIFETSAQPVAAQDSVQK
jgi:parvulin-like peptidyl-prolyl isomerase